MIDQVLADRNFTSGTYPNRNATYVIEVKVWSAAKSLTVTLDRPVFLADIGVVPLGNETLGNGTILAGSYLTYNLRFTVNESKAVSVIPFNSGNVYLGMRASVESGLYSQSALVTNQAIWNWTTATLIIDFGSCFNHCVPPAS